MPKVNIPESLHSEINKTLSDGATADEFIVNAIREKLTLEKERQESAKRAHASLGRLRAAPFMEADASIEYDSTRCPPDD